MKHEGDQAIDLCELVLAVCDERTRNKGVVIVALCEALVIKATRFTHATNADPDVSRALLHRQLDDFFTRHLVLQAPSSAAPAAPAS